jgi:hypothetical protein
VDVFNQVDDETGKPIVNEGYEEETIVFDLSHTISNIPIIVNEDGLIEHEDFNINYEYYLYETYKDLEASLVITDGMRHSVKSLIVKKSEPNPLNYSWSKDFENPNENDLC